MSHSRDDARSDGATVPSAPTPITRREAILRVSALLGGVALVGGSALLTGCRDDRARDAAARGVGEFTAQDVALLDEIADTILPETSTPGAKAAKTGAFMALMVTDSYDAPDQKVFRDGLRTIDEESRKAYDASFVSATPQQRLALIERLDREAKEYHDARERARGSAEAEQKAEQKAAEPLPDQRQEAAPTAEAGTAAAITAESPAHYFRMMKELALLGYFTSEIGYTQAMRYVESPGRFDPCVPYAPGEKAWAPHA
jgi:hypothetical protein